MNNKTEQYARVFEELGLTTKEAQIYVLMLRLGKEKTSILAAKAGMPRTTIYPILKSLIRKGFVTGYLKKNRTFYYPKSPEHVARTFEKKIKTVRETIPALEHTPNVRGEAHGLRFIETRMELEQFYHSILDEYKNKNYLVISDVEGWEEIDPEFFQQFRNERARAGIKTKLLLSAPSKAINPTDTKLLREYRYLPEMYRFKSSIDIFRDKVLIVSPGFSPLAVVLAIPEMVDIFKSIFEILWSYSKNQRT